MADNASESITAINKTTLTMEKELNKSEKKTDAEKGPGYISPFIHVKHFPCSWTSTWWDRQSVGEHGEHPGRQHLHTGGAETQAVTKTRGYWKIQGGFQWLWPQPGWSYFNQGINVCIQAGVSWLNNYTIICYLALFFTSGINPSEEEVQDIINMTDVNYSGKIEWPEFAVALAEKLKPEEDDEVTFKSKNLYM